MPKPKKNESKQEYLKRCTSELVDTENRPADQAYAMCNMYWDQENKSASRQALSLAAPLQLTAAAGDNEARQFMITAYTGQVIDLGMWGKYIFELSGISAKAKIPVLREHKRDRVVGTGKKVWAEEGNLFVAGAFSKTTRDAKEVLSLADEGFPWQASVSIWPEKIKMLDDEKQSATVNGMEISGPIEIWTKSTVGEVSFVSLGADDNTAAISIAQGDTVIADIELQTTIQEVNLMKLAELQEKHPDLYQEALNLGAASIDADQIKTEATAAGAQAERERVLSIMASAATDEAKKTCIEQGLALESCYKIFFEMERQSNADRLLQLKSAAPPSVGALPVETVSAAPAALSLEEEAEKEYREQEPLRKEFRDFETYLAFRKADAKGLVRIKGKTQN